MKAIIAYFAETTDIKTAVDRLKAQGIERDIITLLGSAEAHQVPNVIDNEAEQAAGKGAAVGGSIGATLGLVGSAAVAAIPGIGPIVAAGAMATLTGGFAGGYLGAIYGTRADTQDELTFEDALGQGGVLLIVETTQENVLTTLRESGGQYVGIYDIDSSELEGM